MFTCLWTKKVLELNFSLKILQVFWLIH